MGARRVVRRSVGALVVVVGVALVAAAFGVLLGWRALVTEEHGMEPGIGAGSLLLTRPVDAEDVRAGDVVSVRRLGGDRITRRVVSVKTDRGGEVSLRARADRADRNDARTYPVTTTDVVYAHVPVLGRVVDLVVSLPGLLMVFIVVVLLGMRRRGRARSRAAASGVRG